LENIHKLAFKTAEATHCAGEQGKYWEAHERFFNNQATLGRKDLTAHAQALGLDVAAFDECVDSGRQAARVRKDLADSQKYGITSTPTFVLGLSDANGSQMKVVTRIRGSKPYEAFKEAIDSLLSTVK